MAGWILEGEPVRGGYPPPGFLSLSGAEQVRAFAQGLVPRPPFFRLCGMRVSHAAPGSATLTMPASRWHSVTDGVTVWPLVLVALNLTARTVVPPGVRVFTRSGSVNFLRLASMDAETFVARGRVMLAGGARITTDLSVEDASGRLVAHAVGQSATLVVEPPPPPAPALVRHDEPTYASPDPSARAVDLPMRAPPASGEEFIARVRSSIGGQHTSFQRLFGHYLRDVAEGYAEVGVPLSEWLNTDNRTPAFAFPVFLASTAGVAALSAMPAGTGMRLSSAHFGFVTTKLAPDLGAELSARGRVVHSGDLEIIADAELEEADGERLAMVRATFSVLPRRDDVQDLEERRALATVLFVDVVGSTATIERVGDSKWRELLEQNVALVRREIQAARGREIKSEGDGFLATFDLPAAAIRCARAVRDGVRRHGLEVRAGIHLGEIELIGSDVAGLAVHVAARVESIAGPGTILVTSTVREAMAGSGLSFTSRGTHELQGVSDEWHLYEVEDVL